LSVRYIPDILTGTDDAASFSTVAEFGNQCNIPIVLDKGNFSNEKSRIFPVLQTIWPEIDYSGRTRVDVIIKMHFLEISYSNGKVEIKRIGSLVLYEYETYIDPETYLEHPKNNVCTDIIGMVNHLRQTLPCIVWKLIKLKTFFN